MKISTLWTWFVRTIIMAAFASGVYLAAMAMWVGTVEEVEVPRGSVLAILALLFFMMAHGLYFQTKYFASGEWRQKHELSASQEAGSENPTVR